MKRVLVCIVLGSFATLGVITAAGATPVASTPAAGKIELWVTPAAAQGFGTIVITGAIGDFGKSTGKHNKNGTPDPNGNYGTAKLQKGTFEIDLANIGKAINNAAPTVNSTTTCSFVVTATAPVTLLNGTGAYTGISGTIELTETFAGVLPRIANGKDKGQCNESNSANPIAQWGSVTGSGDVSYS